jgi:hypothetical protein
VIACRSWSAAGEVLIQQFQIDDFVGFLKSQLGRGRLLEPAVW